jgi:hypothetical protein
MDHIHPNPLLTTLGFFLYRIIDLGPLLFELVEKKKQHNKQCPEIQPY